MKTTTLPLKQSRNRSSCPLGLLLFCLAFTPLSVSRADSTELGTWTFTGSANDVWTFTGSMHDARQQHTATLLQDGRVLVAGGDNLQGSLHSAELYDPNTGNWSLTGSLHEGRLSHTATLLGDGRVLVTGGLDYDFPQHLLKSAELYDPATNTWTQTGDMVVAREWHTATLLPNGKVLVVGGAGQAIYASEIYDPDTGSWSLTSVLGRVVNLHTATLLQDGEVLIAGGFFHRVTNLAALYDVASDLWTTTDNLPKKRFGHTATLLPDGTVLAAGGGNFNNGNRVLQSAELYDPLSATWRSTRSLHYARSAHTATLLPSGKVLVAGGGNESGAIASCEQYDSVTQTWALTAALNVGRSEHTATLLPNGKELVAGGSNFSNILGSAELFDPNASQ